MHAPATSNSSSIVIDGGSGSGNGAAANGTSHSAGEGKHKFGVFGLLSVAYFWCASSFYGNEPFMNATAPRYSFMVFLFVPLLFSLPVALMAAEMATALPLDGGQVAWIQKACGNTLGRHHTTWFCLTYTIDSCIYPAMAGKYIANIVRATSASALTAQLNRADADAALGDVSELWDHAWALVIVCVVTAVQLAGSDVLERFSALLTVLTLAPTVAFIIMGSAQGLHPEEWIKGCEDAALTEAPCDWSRTIAWALWLYAGFFSLGSLAGEVENPRKTYPIAILVLMPIVILGDAIPTAVSLSLDADRSHYDVGYFNEVMLMAAGEWLRWASLVASNVCLVGYFNSQTMTTQRAVAFLFQNEIATAKKGAHTRLRQWLYEDVNTGVPPVVILGVFAAACVLVFLPVSVLVECEMLLFTLSSSLFLYAFLSMRHTHPESVLARPFVVPTLGLPGNMAAYVWAAGPTLLTVFYLRVTLVDDGCETIDGSAVCPLGVPYLKLWALGIVLGASLVVHLVGIMRGDSAERKKLNSP